MKRTIQLFCLISMIALLGACTARQVNNSPTASSWRNGVKGQWTLNSVEKENFPTGASVKTIFDEAAVDCFIGSTWNLTGSGKGSITFSQSGSSCSPGAVRDIFWSINQDPGTTSFQFQFKKIMPGDRAKDVTAGYSLDLVSANNNGLVLSMPLNVNGETSYLVFHFSKNQ
ncbi:hypothetical protein [Albibacterium sp.]|uniref:hypothetical protein n=1 Tax=Albibacterium sp. TaxID=2952885 RepID=UPI002B80BD84|nr:hypothetical protein [Albibacterium sp.]HUH19320.1 hypothetical protein [Albibacterium sp.]